MLCILPRARQYETNKAFIVSDISSSYQQPRAHSSSPLPAHIEQCNTRVMIRHHIVKRGPRVEVEVLESGGLAFRQRWADKDVIQRLGIHIIGAADS